MDHAAEFANDVARRFGLVDTHGVRLVFDVPKNERQRAELRARLRGALNTARPIASALSIGEALTRLLVAAKSQRNVRRPLAELDALVQSAAFGRAKRAERARLLAELFVLFEIPASLGLETADDPELSIRLARRDIERLLAG